jgi:hypothetical protein
MELRQMLDRANRIRLSLDDFQMAYTMYLTGYIDLDKLKSSFQEMQDEIQEQNESKKSKMNLLQKIREKL